MGTGGEERQRARHRQNIGYLAALINFRYLAHALWSTDETVSRL